MVFTLSPANILIGVTLDPDDSKELLSWTITNLARPNDTIIALHVLGHKKNKHDPIGYNRRRLRRAKALVISVMGEFAEMCQLMKVKLEARVGFSFGVGRGLIEEAKGLSTRFLLVGRPINPSNRVSREITRYCVKHAPKGCSVVSVGNLVDPLKTLDSITQQNRGHGRLSFRWVGKADKNDNMVAKSKTSPRRVLDMYEGDSNSNKEDSSSFGASSFGGISESPPLSLASENNSIYQKPSSPFKRIFSFLFSSFYLNVETKKQDIVEKEKLPTLLRCFSYEEIARATNDFHPDNVVGRGGFSEVYRGDLDDGRIVAVKRIAKDRNDQKKEKEFLMELGIIGHVNHPNTAVLVGCCIESGLHLLFNFTPNGTLASALHGNAEKVLEWEHRFNIAVGIAKGLHYLHMCCKHRIIHRDIKASNILLGLDYEPQIADFGLAKWLPNKWTHHAVIPIEGTFGYIAPEYFMHGIVDEKIDVFSFGVLLLEIITGRRPVDSSKQNLIAWLSIAKPLMESGKITELVDAKLEGKYDNDQMHRVLLTASYCIRQSSLWRPSMSEVLELLLHGNDSDMARSWRMPKFTSEEMDDYSMVFGYDLPSDITLDDI